MLGFELKGGKLLRLEDDAGGSVCRAIRAGRAADSACLAHVIHAARHMRLRRLNRIGGHFGRQRADFLGLGRKCIDLLLPIGCLQLHDLGEVLGPGQALGQVETRI